MSSWCISWFPCSTSPIPGETDICFFLGQFGLWDWLSPKRCMFKTMWAQTTTHSNTQTHATCLGKFLVCKYFPSEGCYWDSEWTLALSLHLYMGLWWWRLGGGGWGGKSTINACRLCSFASTHINHKINRHNIFFSWARNSESKSLCKW